MDFITLFTPARLLQRLYSVGRLNAKLVRLIEKPLAVLFTLQLLTACCGDAPSESVIPTIPTAIAPSGSIIATNPTYSWRYLVFILDWHWIFRVFFSEFFRS
jgi:hypothetical protein